MQVDRFCTSLAFIPWNHNRSNRATADLFSTHPDYYSLSVHGCDHTWAEFGSSDGGYLRNQARQALERMERHHTRFGLKYDPVMVFPQGIFSSSAVDALESCRYLAAVNSTPFPIDRETLPLRSLLDITVTAFSPFPLFIRRTPGQIAELAFDLFLGRPAIIVAHHDFFSAGYEGISNLVRRLSAVEPALTWASLDTICSRAHLRRNMVGEEIQVRFYTDRLVFKNRSDHEQRFVLFRDGPPTRISKLAESRASSVAAHPSGNSFQISRTLRAGESITLQVPRTAVVDDRPPLRMHPTYEASVFVRRRLSEWKATASASRLWTALR